MFKHDLFISYSHLDNGHLHDPDQGWIDVLHDKLEKRIAMFLGQMPRIWRDHPKLQGNHDINETLLGNLSQVATIISVLSPSYINSEWCLKELREFHNHASASGGVRVDGRSRIFKVIKMPVSEADEPQELQGLPGYDFYFWVDQSRNRFREFNNSTGFNRDMRYWDTLDDLAQDIAEQIKCLRNQQ